MKIKELAKRYDLVKDDFWQHKQSGQWIIKHDAVEKIATMEDIEVDDIKVLNSERDFVRFLITMSMDVKETGEVRTVSTIGEADKGNCMSSYYGSMAEKRGKDRGILKLIRAYKYGVSSEIEADDFRRTPHTSRNTFFAKTEIQKADFDLLVQHSCFSGMSKGYQKRFKETKSISEVNELRQEMLKIKSSYNQSKEVN